MSLKDTIRGAREEASANIGPITRGSGSEESDGATASGQDQGFVRKSTTRAKPKREAAAGVRVVSGGKTKSAQEMSKEEQKAERKRLREKEDRRYAVSQMLLEDDPEYQRLHKVWWRILIVGFVFMVIALATYMWVNQQGETTPLWLAILSISSMVLAYIAIIIAFIYDWRNIRPLRRSHETRAASMSEKRINKTLREREKDK